MIIEQSENLSGHQMMTVNTDRGDEYVIDADAAVQAIAQMFSDYDNEKRFGWQLQMEWFEQEFKKLRSAAIARPE